MSRSKSVEVQRKDTEVRNYLYWKLNCPDCSCVNISDKCHHTTHQSLRLYSCIFIPILCVLLTTGVAVIVTLIPVLSSDNTDMSYAATSYHFNETRLFEVSGFFKEQVRISASDHFNANATLYIMKQSPPLIAKFNFSVNTTVTYDKTLSYSLAYSHYYLHRKSNVTLQACVNTNCDPYHIYIVKGSQNYAKWLKTFHSEKSAFVNTDICSYGQSKIMDYAIEEDDHYYFFYYSTGQCYGGDIFTEKQAGNLSLYIEKLEYSIFNLQFDGACNTYELDSCTVNLPLQVGLVWVLIRVRGQPGDKYDIIFSSTTRKWPIALIAISCVIFLVCTKVIITCWLYHCKKKRRQRRQYVPIR